MSVSRQLVALEQTTVIKLTEIKHASKTEKSTKKTKNNNLPPMSSNAQL